MTSNFSEANNSSGSNHHFPVSENLLALFIAQLARRGYAASSVLTYISALSFMHRLTGLKDPTKGDLVKLALRGYTKTSPSLDQRLPITLPILEQIISALQLCIGSRYQTTLIRPCVL